MQVNYKRAGVWVLQYGKMVAATPDADGKVTQKTVFQGGKIVIVPGLNKIDDAIWEQIHNNPQQPDVENAIADGTLVIIEQPGKKSGKKNNQDDDITSLEAFGQKEAIDIVGGQMDADMLSSWKRLEKRPMVKKAINEQLEKVKEADKIMAGGGE
jgi:hypothetical protein